MNIIGICGVKGSGKDTACQLLQKHYPEIKQVNKRPANKKLQGCQVLLGEARRDTRQLLDIPPVAGIGGPTADFANYSRLPKSSSVCLSGKPDHKSRIPISPDKGYRQSGYRQTEYAGQVSEHA